MASSSSSLSAASHLPLPFLRPQPYLRLQIPHLKFPHQNPRILSLFRICSKSVPTDRIAVEQVGKGDEEKQDSRAELDDYGWSGNGSSRGFDGSDECSNGSVRGSRNGSLVENADLNGAATTIVAEVSLLQEEEEKRKKRVEDIGQEEAWFKRGGKEKVEV